MTLLEFLRSLMFDDAAREAFQENPDQALADAGLDHLSAQDVNDALVMMQDDSQDASFDRNVDQGGNEVNIAAPQPVSHDDDGGSESAAEYINQYFTNNYTTVNDNDVSIDNSTNMQVDTGGGDFDADIDSTVDASDHSVNASGDGAVAAGGDIEGSTIATGGGNTIGDGNVTGDGNTVGDGNTDVNVDGGGTAVVGDGNETVSGEGNVAGFGSGDVESTNLDDVSVGDGSSFAMGGGSSSVDSSTHTSDDDTTTTIDNSMEDSGNTTSSWTDNSDSSDNSSVDDHSSESYSNFEDSSSNSYSEDNDTDNSSDDHSSDDFINA
jgi:hypothetical protein